MDLDQLSNREIAAKIGQKLERVRRAQNRSQVSVAREIGLTPVSYRSLIAGKGKIENLIALMRVLGCLDMLNELVKRFAYGKSE